MVRVPPGRLPSLSTLPGEIRGVCLACNDRFFRLAAEREPESPLRIAGRPTSVSSRRTGYPSKTIVGIRSSGAGMTIAQDDMYTFSREKAELPMLPTYGWALARCLFGAVAGGNLCPDSRPHPFARTRLTFTGAGSECRCRDPGRAAVLANDSSPCSYHGSCLASGTPDLCGIPSQDAAFLGL